MEYKIPQYLHKQHQVLFFESDELAFIMLLFLLALMFGYVFWILLFVLPALYMKIKKKYPRGALKHLFYTIGVISFKGAPSYFEKNYHE